ncbi:MAG: uracil-DNA glycosylase [Saprospiraceae bacterium]
MSNVSIEESWKKVLADQFTQPYFQHLISFIKQEKAAQKVIYPPGSLIFNAFNTTPFDQVKVVILGQDPYINAGEAMGLSFSVPKGIRIPPSLRNIYKELATDLQLPPANHGDLSNWAHQGVFLLNAVLTVEEKRSQSHQKKGWETFTDAVIKTIADQKEHVVFMLWGKFARSKKEWIDNQKHLVLEAAHPSPLAGGAFFGCKHFSKANAYLVQQGKKPIDWRV